DTVCVAIFYFQAEDGIRDKLVTGVQTCALPIWKGRKGFLREQRGRPYPASHPTGLPCPSLAAMYGKLPYNCSGEDIMAFVLKRQIGRASCREECRCRGRSEHGKSMQQ